MVHQPGHRPPERGRPTSTTTRYETVHPPTGLLAASVASLVLAAGLLVPRSFVTSLGGLIVCAVTLALVSAYRLALIKREVNPGFVPKMWQPRAAVAILVVNFLVSIGHAYFIAEEVGKRWS